MRCDAFRWVGAVLVGGVLLAGCGAPKVLDHIDTQGASGHTFPVSSTLTVTVTATSDCPVALALRSDDGRSDVVQIPGHDGVNATTTQQFSLTPGNWSLGVADVKDQPEELVNCSNPQISADVTTQP